MSSDTLDDWICCSEPERPADDRMWLHMTFLCRACAIKHEAEGDRMPFKGYIITQPAWRFPSRVTTEGPKRG
jgi:hypothetical protein